MSFNRSGYIGRAPGDSSITIARKTYEPTGVQTDFTFTAGYDPGYCDVYLNGIRLINGNDYTASNGSVVGLTSAANNGDIVEIVAYKAFNLGQPLSDITGDLTISDTLTATNVSGTTSVTAGTFYGNGSGLTGVASTDYIITGTAATFNSQVKVLNLNVTGITSTTSFNVGSATTIDGGGINVTGVITATTFSGALSGSTGTFSGAVNVDATTDSTSTSTGALIVDGGLGVAKNVYIGAGLSVAGTLTYEDVTSVDSVGMVTAKSGVNVSGGQLQVGVAYSVGAAGVATAAGFVGGTISGTTGTFTGDINLSGTASGVTSCNWDASENALEFKDNSKIKLGDSSDLQLYHDGSNSYIADEGTGGIIISGGVLSFKNQARDETHATMTVNGAVELYYDNSAKFATTNTGANMTGVLIADGFTAYDNEHLKLGTNSDLDLFHSGTDSFIRSAINNLNINAGNSAQNVYINLNENVAGVTSERAASFNKNGSVDLYYDNSKKFETTSAGVTITGTVTDDKGDLRDIPLRSVTGSAATLVAADAGKVVSTNTTGWTVPASTFAEGDTVTLLNNSAGGLTITCSAVTTYLTSDGTTVTSKTLGARGLATLYFVSASVAYLQGTALS